MDTEQEILYRLPEVERISGLRRSTIYRNISEGTFPRPVQLGAQSVAWKKSNLDQWIASRPVVARGRPTEDDNAPGRAHGSRA